MKIVIVVDSALPNGLIANTAAVLGISIGTAYPEIVREPIIDADRSIHAGITSLVIPVLGTQKDELAELVQALLQESDIDVIPFNRIAQGCKDYDEYKQKLQRVETSSIQYSGVALVGPPKKVAKYTGALPLLK